MTAGTITSLEAGSGSRAIVFLHGVGLDAATFRLQLDALPSGWRGVAWNMPGYCGSDPDPSASMAGSAAALKALLDARGIDRAVLAGHSLGGMIALEAWAAMPQRIAGLVLIGTTPMFGSKDGSFEREFIASRFAPLDAGRSMAEIAEDVPRGILGEGADGMLAQIVRDAFARTPPQAYRASIRSMLGFDRRAALATITVPTLLIAGEHDRNAPLRSMQKMAEAIPGAALAIIAGVGHCPHLERPGEVNAVLDEYLRQMPA